MSLENSHRPEFKIQISFGFLNSKKLVFFSIPPSGFEFKSFGSRGKWMPLGRSECIYFGSERIILIWPLLVLVETHSQAKNERLQQDGCNKVPNLFPNLLFSNSRIAGNARQDSIDVGTP